MKDKHFFATADRRYKQMQRAMDQNDEPEKLLKSIRRAIQGGNEAMTNRYWEALTIFLPQCVYQNPRLNIESVVPGEVRSDAVGLQYALESMMDAGGWVKIWRQMAADILAWRCVGMTTVEHDVMYPRHMEGQTFLTWKGDKVKIDRASTMTMPRMRYIQPGCYFRDPDAVLADDARFKGHIWEEDVEFMKGQAEANPDDWHLEAVEELEALGDTGKIKVAQFYTPFFIDPRAVENYSGDEDPEDRALFTGTLYTMIVEGKRAFRDLRRPRLYRGPVNGLYAEAACVPCPGGGEKIAPFAAGWDQVDRDARVTAAVSRQSESFKRLVLASNEMGDLIREVDNDGVVDVAMAGELLQQAIYELTVGGPSPELLAAAELSDRAADRTLGMSDSLRSMASSDTTATSENIAFSSYSSRAGLFAQPMFECIEHMLSTAAWHLEHAPDAAWLIPDDGVAEALRVLKREGLPAPDTATENGVRQPVLYVGGDALKADDNGVKSRAFSGKTVKIVPMSSSRTNEGLQQKAVLDSSNLIAQAVQIKAAFRDFDMVKYLNDQGAKLNLPGLGEYFPANAGPDEEAAPSQMNTNSANPMRQQAQAAS